MTISDNNLLGCADSGGISGATLRRRSEVEREPAVCVLGKKALSWRQNVGSNAKVEACLVVLTPRAGRIGQGGERRKLRGDWIKMGALVS